MRLLVLWIWVLREGGKIKGLEGGMILETNNGNQVEACCMFSVSGGLWGFSRGCYVVLHEITLCRMATLSPPAAYGALSILDDALCLWHTWLQACPTLTRARACTHLNRHCTAVLAFVRAQRSCSEVNPMEANWMGWDRQADLLGLFCPLAFPLVWPSLHTCRQGTSLQVGGALQYSL